VSNRAETRFDDHMEIRMMIRLLGKGVSFQTVEEAGQFANELKNNPVFRKLKFCVMRGCPRAPRTEYHYTVKIDPRWRWRREEGGI